MVKGHLQLHTSLRSPSYIWSSLRGNNKQYPPTKKMKEKRKEARKEHTADRNALMQLDVFKTFIRKKKENHLCKHTVKSSQTNEADNHVQLLFKIHLIKLEFQCRCNPNKPLKESLEKTLSLHLQ